MKPGVLKTCPFCGGRGEPGHDPMLGYWIKCAECGAELPPEHTGDSAAEKWNRRNSDCAEALMNLLGWVEAYTSDNGGLRVRGGSEAREERENAVLAARRALAQAENT